MTERGDLEMVPRRENFRLFACMNPCTDVNKKDLPCPFLFSNFCSSVPTNYNSEFVCIEGFLVQKGTFPKQIQASESFSVTPFVKETLKQISRALMAAHHPILLEGPTSAGKTSIIQHLAELTGHKCVRINNHEQTDLQEDTGCYVSQGEGSLVFQEGLLVEALRNGYWIRRRWMKSS